MFFLYTSRSLSLLRSRAFLATTLLLSCLYLLLQIFFFNHSIFSSTLLGDFPLEYKLKLSLNLISGYFVMFPLTEIIFNTLSALLVGLNLTLMFILMQRVRQSGRVKLSVGGAGVIALMSSGCPGCGLTLLSILGPSTGILAVRVHSLLFQIIILGILVFSAIYSLRKIDESLNCPSPIKKSR